MRIYKMTATFGKLEQQTLALEPGLNIITAPNEWGKSTWCAFLVAMLYGLDTRAKTTRTSLADKERYAPWSGSPMAGRIDLNWKGRDITIERRTKRRVPLGEFRAYETESGLEVEELTASNCGQMILGVEQSVFRRAGFIKHADLPVTQDEALRRRLNALVTTGDDSGAADKLAANLKNLRNSCRYNRTGLLPQAEAKRAELDAKLTEQEELQRQTERLERQLQEIRTGLTQLENHRQALDYARMEADASRVEQAKEAADRAEAELARQEALCATLPEREESQRILQQLQLLREQWETVRTQLHNAPGEPAIPRMEMPFAGMTAEEARNMVRKDAGDCAAMARSPLPLILMCIGVFGILAAAGLTVLKAYVFALAAGIAGGISLTWGFWEKRSVKQRTAAFREKYGSDDYRCWEAPVEEFAGQMAAYEQALTQYRQIHEDIQNRQLTLRKQQEDLCGVQEPEVLMGHLQQTLNHRDSLENARREARIAGAHYESLRSMLRSVEKPVMEDTLSCSAEETAAFLEEGLREQQRLLSRLGQYQGRMETLGSRETLLKQRRQVQQRIDHLENTYIALTIAQETLAEARAELQRRFAPRITRRAQEYLSRMTDGRYHSLTMSEDFSLRAGAGEEETLHDAIWRSDGTMDQLYLALRLAVAQELMPNAPLILDDALVRFDDARMAEAVAILRNMAKEKQILLFTCQGREAKI